MKKYNILHVTPTPLVDSPRKISDTINKYSVNFNSNVFAFNDYPGNLTNKFTQGLIIYKNFPDLVIDLIKKADIIHIHNFLTIEQQNIILENSKNDAKFIYQSHSPLREGPLFVDFTSQNNFYFHKKLVVAQYQPRLFPDFEFVPNLVLFEPFLNLIEDDQIPKILFSPSHSRTGGRWNDKETSKLNEVLTSLDKINKIELTKINGLTPFELFEIRKLHHISIDEIITGSYHQVSLESLAAGNVTINNSDFYTDLILKNILNQDVNIPFYKINQNNITEKLLELIENKSMIQKLQIESIDFFNKYLKPNQLIEKYLNIYDEVIND